VATVLAEPRPQRARPAQPALALAVVPDTFPVRCQMNRLENRPVSRCLTGDARPPPHAVLDGVLKRGSLAALR
jgi:hypothetical protein